MSSSPSRVSDRLRRAVAAERDKLASQRERVERVRRDVGGELERLEHELADIDQRLELLVRVAPAAAEHREPEAGDGHADRRDRPAEAMQRLQGLAIRVTAVRLLAGQAPRVEAIHYRDWYRLLQQHGYTVAGKKPLAVFLTQVSRSPVIRKATAAGVYELDRGAPERLRHHLVDLEADLRALTNHPPNRGAGGEVHARRRELVHAIGRRERALEVALQSLAAGEPENRGSAPR
jgi:hypothetical protein